MSRQERTPLPVVETPWLNTEEAAAYMRRRPDVLKRWRWKGGGPRYYKQGKGEHAPVVYAKTDLDDFIRSEARYSTSDLPKNSRTDESKETSRAADAAGAPSSH